MSAPSRYDFKFTVGSTVVQPFVWTYLLTGVPVDLTGYTAKAQVKDAANLAVALLTLTDTSGIALGGALGTFTITFTKAQTLLLPSGSGYVWDLRLTDASGADTYLLSGSITVLERVTT